MRTQELESRRRLLGFVTAQYYSTRENLLPWSSLTTWSGSESVAVGSRLKTPRPRSFPQYVPAQRRTEVRNPEFSGVQLIGVPPGPPFAQNWDPCTLGTPAAGKGGTFFLSLKSSHLPCHVIASSSVAVGVGFILGFRVAAGIREALFANLPDACSPGTPPNQLA